MIPYGSRRNGLTDPDERAARHKGAERSRVRVSLIPALGPVPKSLTGPAIAREPACTCADCLADPEFAMEVRGWEEDMEAMDLEHLEEIG